MGPGWRDVSAGPSSRLCGMLLRHGVHYLVARGLPGVLNFLAIAIYTRLLNPDQYGAYTLTIAAVGAADAVLLRWLRLTLLRFLPKAGNDATTTLATLFRMYLALALGVSALTIASAWLFIDNDFTRQLVLLGAGIFVVQGAFEITTERERSVLSPMRYGFYSGSKALIGLLIGAGLAAAGMGAIGLLIGLIASMLFPLIALGGATEWLAAARKRFDPELARQLARYGLPLAATGALAFVISSSDRFMLAGFIDQAAAGQYAVGYDLAQFTLGMLLTIVNLAAYPLIVSAFEKEGSAAAQQMLRWTLRLLLVIGLPAAIGLSILAQNIAAVMVGAEFRAAAAVIIPGIAIAALVAGLKSFYLDLSFQLSGSTIIQVWIVIITASLNVGLNVLLIPRVGILGAVYATLAAQLVAMLLSWGFGRREFVVPLPDKEAFPIFLAAAAMGAGLVLISGWRGPLALLAQVAIGVTLYALCLLIIDRRFFHKLASYGS